MCPMLSVSLNCLPTESCVPNVATVSELSSSWVLCTQCCQCLWIVFLLSLMCPLLLVSLDCLPPESYVPNVASVSGLSSSWVLCAQWCQCLWIVFLLSLMCPMLPVSPRWRQTRDTGNIEHIRLRRKTIQRHWQQWAHKTQEEDNSETLTTLGT
jgi:hypothetical protein